jgi:hypothetical protein
MRLKEINDASETENWKIMSRAALEGETGREMRALDAQLETALVQAKVDGCLEPNRVTKCDWSPHFFADVVQGSLLEQKQKAWKNCMKWTKGDFTAGVHIRAAQTNRVPGITCEDCTVSTTKMDEYFTKLAAALATIEIKYDAKTKKPILGGSTGDSSSEGMDMFSADARWTAGYAGKDFIGDETKYCESNVRSYGTFNSSLKVIGVTIPIIDANLDLYTRDHPSEQLHASASLRVFGQDLMAPINGDQPTWNKAGGPSTSKSQGAATYILVGPVPLKLEAGATGSVGLDYALSGSVKRNCTNATRNNLLKYSAAIKGSATVKPWLKFEAYASVSLDLVIAEAGIEGRLTLIKISLPLVSTLEVKPAGPQNKLAFVTDTNLDLDFRTLDGEVVAFVRLLDDEWQKRIFGWSGLHTTQALFDWNGFSLPLDMANTAFSFPQK